MKLLLTSIGLSNKEITSTFIKLLAKNISEVKVAFVPTAAVSEEEKQNVEKARQELLNLGIKEENIREVNVDRFSTDEIMSCDVMYVCGGNTFYLLHKIRETGFDEVIKQFIGSNKVYVGVSAGSIIVSPSISIASVEPADPNDIGLTDFTGLNLIDFEVSPHVPEVVSYENAEKYSRGIKTKLYAFDHQSAVVVEDDKVILVAGGRYEIYN